MPRLIPALSSPQPSGRRSSSAPPPPTSASPNATSATAIAATVRRRPARRAAPMSPSIAKTPAPRAYQAREVAAGSSSTLQCGAPNAASATNALPRASARGSSGPRAAATRGRSVPAAAGWALTCRPARAKPLGASRHGGHRGPAARARADVAVAAGDLEHAAALRDLAGDHEQAAARRAPEAARDAVDDAGGDEHDEPAPVLGGDQRRPGAVVHQRPAGVGARERLHVRLDDRRPPVAGQQQRAAGALGEVHA